jgi:drug/metabolite transporter (DMT)-like permease
MGRQESPLRRIVAAALGVSLLWGSGWMFMKLGTSSFPPFLLAGTRGVLAGIILLAIVRWQRQRLPQRGDLIVMALVGVLMTGVSNGITFWGQARLSSSLAALVWCIMPFFTAIASHFLVPGQRLNQWRIMGLLLGLSGVWLILSTQHLDGSAATSEGKAAIVIAAALWALSLVLNKRLLSGADSTLMTGVQLLTGGVFLLPLSMATEKAMTVQITPGSVAVFLMMLFGQGIIAYLCYYYLLSKVSATAVSMMSFVTPSIAVILGVLLLGEVPYWQMGAGLLLVTAGIITVNMLGQQERVTA